MVCAYLLFGTVVGYLAGGVTWYVSGSFGTGMMACMLCGVAAVFATAAAHILASEATKGAARPEPSVAH